MTDDANPSFYFAGVEYKLTNIRVVTKSNGFVYKSRYVHFNVFITTNGLNVLSPLVTRA